MPVKIPHGRLPSEMDNRRRKINANAKTGRIANADRTPACIAGCIPTATIFTKTWFNPNRNETETNNVPPSASIRSLRSIQLALAAIWATLGLHTARNNH